MKRAVYSAILLSLLVVTGCARRVVDDRHAVVDVGRDAAHMMRARAARTADQIAMVEAEHGRLGLYSRALWSDFLVYRHKEAVAWQDAELLRRERPAYARMYGALAENRENQVERCGDLMSSYDSSITLLTQRHDEYMRDVAHYESLKVPAPL